MRKMKKHHNRITAMEYDNLPRELERRIFERIMKIFIYTHSENAIKSIVENEIEKWYKEQEIVSVKNVHD